MRVRPRTICKTDTIQYHPETRITAGFFMSIRPVLSSPIPSHPRPMVLHLVLYSIRFLTGSTMVLTDAAIRQALPKETDYWITDARGLRLLVKTSGGKYWRLKYRFDGKQKTFAVGVYPEVSLKAARELTIDAKRLLDRGIDPGQDKKEKHRNAVLDNGSLFSLIAKEWWEHQRGTWSADHANRIWGRFESDVFPFIGSMSITDVSPQDVIAIIRRIEARDALDIASRVLQDVRRVCRYAVQSGRLKQNPASELSDILKNRKEEHRPSLPRGELPAFLSLYLGCESVQKCAVYFRPLRNSRRSLAGITTSHL